MRNVQELNEEVRGHAITVDIDKTDDLSLLDDYSLVIGSMLK
jgi:hypothetical protein